MTLTPDAAAPDADGPARPSGPFGAAASGDPGHPADPASPVHEADPARLAYPAGQPLAAVLTATRPPRPGAWSVCRVFAWRALLKVRHVPEQLSDVIAVPIVFTLLFTYLFGGALAGSPHRYLQTLLPGTLVMAVLLATMFTGVNLNADHQAGIYDRFRTLSMWRPAPIVGALLGDTARYLLASALVVGLGLALGFRPHGAVVGVLVGVALVVAFASALSWVFCWLGLVLRSPSAVTNLAFLVLFPLTMASNTFVDPHTMPGFLRAVVTANPVTYLVTATRDAMTGTARPGQAAAVLGVTVATTAVFAPLTMRAYSRKS